MSASPGTTSLWLLAKSRFWPSQLNLARLQAVLPVPESQNLAGYQFSPDGRYVAAATAGGSVQLWDLERLRATLREAGLDWDP